MGKLRFNQYKVDPRVTHLWKKISAITGTPVFKPIICIEQKRELLCKPDEISDTLAARNVQVSNSETLRKDEDEEGLDLVTKANRPRLSAVTGDTAAGPDGVP